MIFVPSVIVYYYSVGMFTFKLLDKYRLFYRSKREDDSLSFLKIVSRE